MSATITYTPINQGEFWTIAQLNQFFATLATVINGKLDVDETFGIESIVVGSGEAVIDLAGDFVIEDRSLQFVTVAAGGDVIDGLGDIVVVGYTQIMNGEMMFNYQELLNLAPGAGSNDAVNVYQALTLLGII